jgi:hypothetical protein
MNIEILKVCKDLLAATLLKVELILIVESELVDGDWLLSSLFTFREFSLVLLVFFFRWDSFSIWCSDTN